MPVRNVQVLIVSPPDVAEERKIAEELIKEWNAQHSREYKLVLSVASASSVDECDVAIGMFWTRIGTSDDVVSGGTVENIQSVMHAGKKVMFYFSNVAYRRKDVDSEQMRQLDEFRESVQSHGWKWEYDERHEFRELLARHLDMLVPQWFFPLETEAAMSAPKAFIAYSWDDDVHKRWVADLAARLRGDGVETILDQWHAMPGDQLPDFMEREIRDNDFVLIVCTPRYRSKCDNRDGGAGYEVDIMTAEVYTQKNHRKFIPVLAKGSWNEAASSWLSGKFYIDLSSPAQYNCNYPRLLEALLGSHPSPPPVKPRIPEPSVQAIFKGPEVGKVEQPPILFCNKNEEQAEYIRIPGGSYRYSVTGKEEHVPDLEMARYPVTNKRYRAFIAFLQKNDIKIEQPGSRISASSIREELKAIAKRELWWPKFGDYLHEGKNDLVELFCSKYDEDQEFGGDDHPVVGISWYASRAYCLWLSMLEGNTTRYRLPTEIEWEWAAGGKRGAEVDVVRTWPWSEEEGELSPRLANYNNTVGATTPVGSYPDGATPEGLYDMAGNVWEWMDNWFDENNTFRSLRGGSWVSKSDNLRCSARNNLSPGYMNDYIGFRVVRSSHSSSF
ncbi:MAG: SUMF1/EgtB/PvdO family nonheme iron enzyme [Chlorobiaceae bacterium]